MILTPYGCRRFGVTSFRSIGRANSLVDWSPACYDRGAATVQARGRTMNTVGAAGSSAAAYMYRGADKSLARAGRKRATATEDFDFHISYL